METLDCSCKGINPSCEKCFGRGYYDLNQQTRFFRDFAIKVEPDIDVKSNINAHINFETFAENLTKSELQKNIEIIIGKVDLLSKKQIMVLNTSSFRNRSYRRLFNVQFETLLAIEKKKKSLKWHISILVKFSKLKNNLILVRYKHFLSNLVLNTDSAKELKHIRRLGTSKKFKK